MRRDEQGTLLRIFFGESDRLNHRPLYEVIVEEARARCGAFITTEHIRVIRHTPGSPPA